mmetsp:Transcript_18980/g.44230  ORF Transcript_18980/g.44230 Transcript_18980/m.44230 type:complete len:1510 (+) Transcript_18980:51-4580(+)
MVPALTALVLVTTFAAGNAACPAMCSATTDNSVWPCRYYSNGCQVPLTPNPSRVNATDINLVVISPYSGGLGELMTMVEPALAMAAQEVEDSAKLPGFRLNIYIGDSKCTSPGAIGEIVEMLSQGPAKHILMGDSCSESCEALSDAARFFNVLQVSPGCTSMSLSDSTRFPYFTRLAPSNRFNVEATYEFMKLMDFHRVGIIYGRRSINVLGKDWFVDKTKADLAAGAYNWTVLFTHEITSEGNIQDAQDALQVMEQKDARIIMLALYQAEGAMVLCQSYKAGYYSPDYNFIVSSGWWNPSFINERAGQTDCPCTVTELRRAAYGLIAVDRGPMEQTSTAHGLSGRQLAQIYADYTQECQNFGGGAGICNHNWAGYYYDSLWLIADVLHSYLIDGSRSESDLGTEAARVAMENLALQADFQGITGRVRLFNSVDPTTTPPSLGDREGVIVLRQAGGPADSTFTVVASRTSGGMVFHADLQWSPSAAHTVSCSSGTCNLATGYVPSDRAVSCAPGTAWTNDQGCVECPIGSFASGSMPRCELCPPGSISAGTGTANCGQCPPGTFTKRAGSTFCEDCSRGMYELESGSSECTSCPVGTYAASEGQASCTNCPPQLTTLFEAAMDPVMCICESGKSWEGECIKCRVGTRFDNGVCVKCSRDVICEDGEIVGNATTDAEWSSTIDLAGRQQTLSQVMTNNFLLLVLGLDSDAAKQRLREATRLFEDTLHYMLVGNATVGMIEPPTEELKETIENIALPATAVLIKLLTENMENPDQASEAALYNLYEDNQLLFDVSGNMLSMLMDAAQAAGAVRNTLLASVAGRQRSIIQKMLAQVLFIAKGVAVESSVKELMYNVELFEESHNAILRGADWAGIPQLTQLCTIHQMKDVTFSYRDARGLARQVFNAQTNAEAVAIAQRVAKNMSGYTEPLSDAMNAAAAQFIDGPSSCNPVDTITDGEWTMLIAGLADQRISSQLIARLYLQVANLALVEQSKVELAVEVSSTSEKLVALLEGNKATGMPAPPTQEMINGFVLVGDQWAMMSSVFNDAISQDVIPEENVQRIANLLQSYQVEMVQLMRDVGQASIDSGSEQPLGLLDAASEQMVRIQKLPQEASLIHFGYQVADNLDRMNATALGFRSTHLELVLGDGDELRQVTNVCLVHEMRIVADNFENLEMYSRRVAAGVHEAFAETARLTDEMSVQMQRARGLLERYYSGQNLTCMALDQDAMEWQALMIEAYRMCSLAHRATADFVLAGAGELVQDALELSMKAVNSSQKDLMLGRTTPYLPTQPNQALYNLILSLEPLLGDFSKAADTGRARAITSAAAALCTRTQTMAGRYLESGIEVEPTWPGERVQALQKQLVSANKAFSAAVQSAATDMYNAIEEFESIHMDLHDGGNGLPVILPERQDLMAEWEATDSVWQRLKRAMTSGQSTSEMTMTLKDLENQLARAVPAFSTPDVINEASSPWFFLATYGSMGVILCTCSCFGCYMYRRSSRDKSPNVDQAASQA